MKSEEIILSQLAERGELGRTELAEALPEPVSDATLKRTLQRLVQEGKLETTGRARATRYRLSAAGVLFGTVDLDAYFDVAPDERAARTGYNFDLIEHQLPQVALFSERERETLLSLQAEFERHLAEMTPTGKQRELTRLGIDLSWKSSQIEGNTYTLLETERLLREREEAEGKTREEAIMLLNHKAALDFIARHTDYLQELSVAHIEDIHSLLVQDLHVERNIRRRRVGIIGTVYRPLDNEFQIREALEAACRLVNGTTCVFSKALLTLVLLSYIQAFEDGNKRVARIAANAVLMAHGYCPLSYRSVNALDYKKAMLLFYERNNISAIKDIFMGQYAFAVNTYF